MKQKIGNKYYSTEFKPKHIYVHDMYRGQYQIDDNGRIWCMRPSGNVYQVNKDTTKQYTLKYIID